MTEAAKNNAASVRARLMNVAKISQKSFNLIMQLYIQERLIYRLSVSPFVDKFILKGGLLLYSISQFRGRPTRDIDFLALHISNDHEEIEQILQEAIFETFQRRKTLFEKDNALFREEFAKDPQRNLQWILFLKRIGKYDLPFEIVMNAIMNFLQPVFDCIIKETEFFKAWDHTNKKWL